MLILIDLYRGEVIGEYYGSIAQERQNRHADYLEGVYRLSIASADGTEVYTTTCLPYNITAADMKYSLEDLPLVSRNGGVSVRRYGNGNSSRFLYGYTYRIELDSPSTNVYDLGPLSMSVHCYGSGECGCAETKVPLIDRTGRPQCPTSGKVSLVDENACVIPPIIGIQRISTLSYALTSGKGSITIGEGVHRLPPVSSVEIETLSGIGVVAADIIAWFSLRAIDEGTFIFAGKGWAGWDSSYLLYSPDDTFGKGFVERLDAAPAFSMTLDQFYLDGVGSVLMSCPNSTMKWSTGVLAGGIVGGRGTLSISGLISATGGTKSIRYALNLIIEPTATLEWLSGNIVLADGAYIYVEGRMTVNSINSPIAIGESHTLLSTSDPTIYSANSLFLQRAPGRLFHGYFDRTLPAELRGGFYRNPICGNQCLQTNYITFLGSSVLEIASESEVTFYLPLNLDGQSNLVIGSSVLLNLASGGVCGTKVIIDISSGTTLELSGGRMLMGATCTIRGQGELLVSAGQHDLGFSIDAHITISGGTMVWPLSRGPGSTITFNGGLLIDSVGELQIEPFSTTIVVNQEVHLKDSGLIQFPLLGISAQASPYDRQDAPDTSPRGNLTATGIMRWDGGTIRGKADFNALDILYLDGQVKNIRSLAKLVNRGHCEWGTGDIIIADNGGFLNLGSLQMLEGVEKFTANALYQGTEVPLENGGDVFALEYHSFDNDEGALDYTQYVDLRTRFVSRAPNGWSEDLQN